MVINKKIKITAIITLAFFIMLLLSMITATIRHNKENIKKNVEIKIKKENEKIIY
jgi:hypothetical protein